MSAESVAVGLFAAANDQGVQDVRPMYDAIIRGLARGPVGIMDELALEGITTERVDRIAELEDQLTNLKDDCDAAEKRVSELEREVDQDEETIEALREEVDDLRAIVAAAPAGGETA